MQERTECQGFAKEVNKLYSSTALHRIREAKKLKRNGSLTLPLALAACGGGGGSPSPVQPTPNKAPTDITLSATTIDENLTEATVIGTLATIDSDDTSHSYTVSDDRFEVVSSELRLKAGNSLNYETIQGSGTDATISITITTSDPDGASYTETFTITVVDVDEPLVVSGTAAIAGLENNSQVITSAELLANATGDAPVVSDVTVSAGILVDNGDGTWTYIPDDNWHGDVTLSYTVTDGAESVSASATLSIEEKTFTIPFGDFAGTVLHFNDPLLPFQSNLLGFSYGPNDSYYSTVHINIASVWEEYSGNGIWVGSTEVIDNNHPELINAYVDIQSVLIYGWTYEERLSTLPSWNYHGTATAGIISSEADNGIGLVGIAYGAAISSLNDGGDMSKEFDILTNSTGASSARFFVIFPSLINKLVSVVEMGRDGFGTISVTSAGNAGSNDMSSEADILHTKFEIMPVALTTSTGFIAGSTFGSGVHISAPLSTLGTDGRAITLDRLGELGAAQPAVYDENGALVEVAYPFTAYSTYGFDVSELGVDTGDYTSLGGSSGAAPTVAGSVALVLEASGNNIFSSAGLGWRDVQEILALSARHTGSAIGLAELYYAEHRGWTINGSANFNGGGMHFSPDYGFGMLDVHAAVRLAETWTLQHVSANLVTHDRAVGSGEVIDFGTAIEYQLDMTGFSDLDLDVVSLDLDISHDNWSELQITLISPDGTESIVFDTPGLTANNISENSGAMTGQLIWTVLSRAFWGENTDGVWTIRIEDVVDNGNSGTVNSITSHFQGDAATDDDTYFFTDDWSLMNEANGAIPELDDALGTNTINAAAVMADVMLNMSAGSMSQIGGADAFSLSATTDIAIGITGDGNDTITGLSAGDSVYAMRGDDRIEISSTDFAVIDGYRGNDTLALTGDGMVLDFSTLTGTITGIENIDLTADGAQSVTLAAADLLALSDSVDSLYITGNSDDQFTSIGEGWTQDGTITVDDITYNIYTLGSATLYVDVGMWQDVG